MLAHTQDLFFFKKANILLLADFFHKFPVA